MKSLKELVPEVETYVTQRLISETPKGLVYHTIDHTSYVVSQAEIIGMHEKLNEEEICILKIAAWFHDVGYLKKYRGHEKISMKIAADYLILVRADSHVTEQVLECILATKVPQQPKNKISAVLCDADMIHMGTDQYFEMSKKLRKELNETGKRRMKKKEFKLLSIKTFKKHHYHTRYCQGETALVKKRNLAIMLEETTNSEQSPDMELPKKSKKNNKLNSFSRGADSMLRLTARNQISLSSIADNKSNILISLNGIIISLGLALLVRKFEEKPEIIIPTIIFLIFSLVTIIFAIFSTRPHISTGKSGRKNAVGMKVNLLFFGNFYKMRPEEYVLAIGEMIRNDSDLYSAMIRDQYFLGKVLARKYQLLKVAYGIFMIGLIVSVFSFVLVYLPL